MLQHEMSSVHSGQGGIRKRYLPPKWGYPQRNPIQTVHPVNPTKNPVAPIKTLSALSDRTICIGSEQLPFPFPMNPDQQVPYLNVLNSFIRYSHSTNS